MEAFKKERKSSARANGSSSTPSADSKLSELEKKNANLTSKLSTEQIRCEKKTSELRALIFELKSSLAEKDSELNSSAADLVSRKDAYFRLERKNADIFISYDKLLARFSANHKFAKKSKLETIIDVYKLGYLDCTKETAPFYAIGDKDIEVFCPDLLPVQSEQVNATNMDGAKKQAAEEAVVEEDGAEKGATDEMVASVVEQTSGATEGLADQVDAEEVTN
ncbi:unnamed protein product [Prunus armeniaca]